MRSVRLVFGSLCAAIAVTGSLVGQQDCDLEWDDDDRVCEVREFTLGTQSRLVVDGGKNGGVSVTGWDRNEVVVRARVWANARSSARALELQEEVTVVTADGRIHAEGPRTGRGESWGVSFEVFTPENTDLDLTANNGGISIESVRGDIDFETRNGGVSLTALSGDVHGRTQNGGVRVVLDGAEWDGEALDVETRNGGVTISIPEGYDAEFETGTVNGGINIDFPIRVQGRIGRHITTTLGEGGPLVRVMTTNGGVRVLRP